MKAYVVALVAVDDPDRYKPYAESAPATIAKFGGRYLVRNGQKHLLEGEVPNERLVIVEFPSVEQAKEWYDSETYQSIRPIRLNASSATLFIIEGQDEGVLAGAGV